ncbi:MAG: DUF808 domain-containing protein, partial [Pyrinomonadaceae bacterium]
VRAAPYASRREDSEHAGRGGIHASDGAPASGRPALSAGLAALLDDVAALARAAAASVDDVAAGASRASVKAAGVIVDDAAVTPRYVQGFRPERELPMIKRIAVGSLRNKLLFILPAALLLSELLPWLLTPILMIGGAYLCYEGAEKVWEAIRPHGDSHDGETPVSAQGPEHEDALVGGAIRTDFILSAEIMVISLNEVADEPFVSRALILVVVALAITAVVYGAVALIVKMDDIGLHLAARRDGGSRALGRALVHAMPRLMAALSVIGIAAMIWVGGGIIVHGLEQFGWAGIAHLIHDAAEAAGHAVPALGGLIQWVVAAAGAGLVGLALGAAIVAVHHGFSRKH